MKSVAPVKNPRTRKGMEAISKVLSRASLFLIKISLHRTLVLRSGAKILIKSLLRYYLPSPNKGALVDTLMAHLELGQKVSSISASTSFYRGGLKRK